ncbi:MAG: DNA recombination protein RmuC [Clostridia bacterium]|nr:DNA recombination protein RmuC [Clostridia bacterium]MBQ5725217.1 DNA recombination protein RmuC [Clostridia bacterium]
MERLSQSLRASQRETAELQDKRIETMQSSLQALLSERMDGLGGAVNRRLEEMERQFRELRETNTAAQAELRRTVEERLQAMQTQNRDQLAEMRATVDEKLQKTLNDRISESFKAVNERLGEVYRGLGEMQALAGDVGDLKKVMAGVKTRGILGEIQLRAIIEELLAPEQYEENIATRPGSQNRVEFAVRLPGEGDGPVYLPIDAKFPADAYHHVLEAYEAGDPERIKVATAELERRVKDSAKDIRDKYIEPPYTTTFGILFLPFEGLYAEVVRLGLVDTLQQQYRISVAGPTTLAALLNSLQMGFRTLAIQRRSNEVWEVLGAVKTEFGRFETVLAKAQERISQTGDELEKLIGTRTRQINRKLRSVSELPAETAGRMLESTLPDEE